MCEADRLSGRRLVDGLGAIVITNYHSHYGYPWRWAITAEFFWRLEHLPLSYEGQLFAPVARWGYRMRKTCERRGAKL